MGGPFGIFNIHSVAKQQKIEGGPFGEKLFSEKKSHNAEKLIGGTLWDFQHPFCRKTSKN